MDFAGAGAAESSGSMEAAGSAFPGDSLDRCSLRDSALIASVIRALLSFQQEDLELPPCAVRENRL